MNILDTITLLRAGYSKEEIEKLKEEEKDHIDDNHKDDASHQDDNHKDGTSHQDDNHEDDAAHQDDNHEDDVAHHEGSEQPNEEIIKLQNEIEKLKQELNNSYKANARRENDIKEKKSDEIIEDLVRSFM